MNNALQAYNVMTSPAQMLHPSGPSTRLTSTSSIMFLKQNKPNMVL